MFGAQELARGNKTQSMIAKLNEAIMPMYERYRDRTVPLNVVNADGTPSAAVARRGWVAAYPTNPRHVAARVRLDALRELQRMEMPDRWSDVVDPPVSGITRPSASVSYLQFYASHGGGTVISGDNQGAECLYLIVSRNSEDGLEAFSAADIQDVDGDGAQEFVDGWGRPISFLRWPVGFDSPMHRIAQGAVTSSPSAGTFEGNPQLSNAHGQYNGMVVRFTTGALRGQTRFVTTYSTLDNPGDDPADPTKPRAARTFDFSQPPSPQPPRLGHGPWPTAPRQGDRFVVMARDSLDVAAVYPTNFPTPPTPPPVLPTFDVVPLIFSAGPDGILDITTAMEVTAGDPFNYADFFNNPYVAQMVTSAVSGGGSIDLAVQVGTPRNVEAAGDGLPGDMPTEHLDNITNHDLTRR